MSTLPEGRASATRPQHAPCDAHKHAMADSQTHTQTSRPEDLPGNHPGLGLPQPVMRTSAKPARLKVLEPVFNFITTGLGDSHLQTLGYGSVCRYIPDPSLKRQTLTSKQGLLS